jgi:hypothetical protein
MKCKSAMLSVILFSTVMIADTTEDHLGVKGPLNFDHTDFKLVWTDKPRENYYIQEYLPAGEKTADFNQMLTIHLFAVDMKIKDAVQQKVKELTERKKTDAVCNFVVNKSPDGAEYMVDFVLGESKNDLMTIVEFNIYRYRQVDIGNNKKGIEVYAYSKRSYGDSITEFFKNLKDTRTDYLNKMIAAEMPSVKIK